jgi:hypothetical protein
MTRLPNAWWRKSSASMFTETAWELLTSEVRRWRSVTAKTRRPGPDAAIRRVAGIHRGRESWRVRLGPLTQVLTLFCKPAGPPALISRSSYLCPLKRITQSDAGSNIYSLIRAGHRGLAGRVKMR